MTAEELGSKLTRLIGTSVTCSLTSNKLRVVSIKRGKAGLEVKVPNYFTDAPQDILLALASFCAKPKEKYARILHSYALRRCEEIKSSKRESYLRLSVKGVCYDLEALFNYINQTYFNGECSAHICWGKRTMPKYVVRMGSYEFDSQIIRIHPILDNPDVPQEIIEDVIFHEILHWKHGASKDNDRNVFHSKEMRKAEKKYPGHIFAAEWRKTHLPLLIKKYRILRRKEKN